MTCFYFDQLWLRGGVFNKRVIMTIILCFLDTEVKLFGPVCGIKNIGHNVNPSNLLIV